MNRTEKPSQESRIERQNTRELIGSHNIIYVQVQYLWSVYFLFGTMIKALRIVIRTRIMVDY